MCGIFGLITDGQEAPDYAEGKAVLTALFELSESRGKEASGLAVRTRESISVLKAPHGARHLIRQKEFDQILTEAFSADAEPRVLVGHARLVTNGSLEDNANNQPVISGGLVGVHNGIIVNDAELWRRHPDCRRTGEVDTEVLLAVSGRAMSAGKTFTAAVAEAFGQIEGSASVAILSRQTQDVVLATNTGSLYLCARPAGKVLIFASERYILEQIIASGLLSGGDWQIRRLNAGQGCLVRAVAGEREIFDLRGEIFPKSSQTDSAEIRDRSPGHDFKPAHMMRLSESERQSFAREFTQAQAAIGRIRRCSRCILPETMPFINYDEHGVCNYCRHYRPMRTEGVQALADELGRHRSADGSPDCLVTFSGGRDSSYSLHYLVRELGMHPIAYSYDWGMLTDLGRRNQARMTGALGVEHILVSADIARKRRYIGLNVKAWLRRPDLGTVPLFMAGDKQFFYYANRLKQQTRTPVIVFGENFLEKTDFKYGFCGIAPQFGTGNIHRLKALNSLRLIFYYARQYLANPAFVNASLLDTFTAYLSYYVIPHDYLYFFRYIRWDEATIESTLINQYNWETAADAKTTWRIGDGTAAFYNYIYYLVAGLTENDTFRSNQIREGMLSREEALRLMQRDNQPRYDSLEWYCDTIGVDCRQALQTIHRIPRMYEI